MGTVTVVGKKYRRELAVGHFLLYDKSGEYVGEVFGAQDSEGAIAHWNSKERARINATRKKLYGKKAKLAGKAVTTVQCHKLVLVKGKGKK